jgi:hypothetical protein
METENKIVAKWAELKSLVEETETHVLKNARGVAAAGVRSRKGLRQLKVKAAELVAAMIETDKSNKATKAK